MNPSFLECYQILEITEECDWLTLRKQYKSLIQRHHPDRFQENTDEYIQAEDKIRSFNAAYKIIADFHQQHQALPPRTHNNPSQIIYHQPRKKRPQANHKADKRVKTTRDNTYTYKRMSIIIAVFVIPTIVIHHIYENDQTQDNSPAFTYEDHSTPDQKILLSTDNHGIKNDPLPEEEFFTTGSNIGEVILIQGKPSRIEGDVWYYGKSSITFSKGVVTDWKRHADNPLKAKISEIPTFQLPINTQNNAKEKPANTPYWKQ